MLVSLLSVLSAVVTIYTICCFINILLSWIPGSKFTKFGRIISKITDPYMNFFSQKGLFRIGNLDFSPIISIGLLSLVSSILAGVTKTGKFSLGSILSTVIALVWNMCSSLFSIVFLLIFVRWLVLLIKKGQTDYNSIWVQIDSVIGNACRKFAGKIVKKPIKYETSLLITWISLLIIIFITGQLVRFLAALCLSIPI